MDTKATVAKSQHIGRVKGLNELSSIVASRIPCTLLNETGAFTTIVTQIVQLEPALRPMLPARPLCEDSNLRGWNSNRVQQPQSSCKYLLVQ